MRTRVLTVVVASLCVMSGASSASTSPIEVFVLAGQSNMVGYGQPLSDGAAADPDLLLWKNDAWREAKDPLASSEAGVGPGMTFGLRVLADQPSGTTVGLVMCAVGSTTIQEWQPGGKLYRNCVEAARATGGHVSGILFLQGESEAQSFRYAQGWESSFTKMQAAFEEDLGPAVFLLGQIGTLDAVRFPAQQVVRDAQADAAASLPGISLVTSSDLPVGDGVHFTADAQLVLGTRFGNAFNALDGRVLITSFSPTSAPAGGQVTINGLNLGGSNLHVKFAGTPASIVSQSENQVVAVVPPQAAAGPIAVTTGDGTSDTRRSFAPVPRLTVTSPNPAEAGNSLTLTGTNLLGASGLTLGKNALGIASVDSALQITTDPLPATAVTDELRVATPSGASNQLTLDVAPTVSSLSSTSGVVGSYVTITGGGFSDISSISFNGGSAKFKVGSATSISARVPSDARTGPVSVTNTAGTALFPIPFAVLPGISKFSPSGGNAGTSVSILGSGLADATAVRFNGVPAAVSSRTATNIVAVVPDSATVGAITVTTPSGSTSSSRLFKPVPVLTIASPSPAKAGNVLTITGTNLLGASLLMLDKVLVPIATDSATQITTGPLPGAASTGKLVVFTAAGGSNKLALPVAPTITSFAPGAGTAGASIILQGTGLKDTRLVELNGVKAGFNVRSPTELKIKVPPGATDGKITVTTSGGTALTVASFDVLG